MVIRTLVLLMLVCVQQAFAQQASLESAEIRRTENSLVLATTVALDLTGPVENALSKGIAVSFVSQVRLEKARWYWYDKVLYQSERQARLSYLPLTRKWRVQFSEAPSLSETGLSQQFDSLHGLLPWHEDDHAPFAGHVERIQPEHLAGSSDSGLDLNG